MNLLLVKGLHKNFGGVKAVNGCDFTVKKGSITALIGPNGAGKTTVFNLITGLVLPDEGSITFKGEELSTKQSHQIFSLGLARTFQLLRLFGKLSVLENLMLAHPGRDDGMFDLLFRRQLVFEEEKKKKLRCMKYLRMVGLDHMADVRAGELSYGQQKLVDIARCLASESELLLFDEPVAGVNPTLREGIKKLFLQLKKEGRTILIIEHDMNFIMDMSDEVIVLDHGEEIATGKPSLIKKNKKVIEAYLGKA